MPHFGITWKDRQGHYNKDAYDDVIVCDKPLEAIRKSLALEGYDEGIYICNLSGGGKRPRYCQVRYSGVFAWENDAKIERF